MLGVIPQHASALIRHPLDSGAHLGPFFRAFELRRLVIMLAFGEDPLVPFAAMPSELHCGTGSL